MTEQLINLENDARLRDSFVNYDLTAEDMAAGQAELLEIIKDNLGNEDGVFAVWIQPQNPLANVVRTLEKITFPEIQDVMEGYEEQSMFLALVDTRDSIDRIAHAFRISGAFLDDELGVVAGAELDEEGTNIVLIDDIIKSNQGLTSREFKEYYMNAGLDLSKCISVETNWRVGDKSEKYNGLPLSQLGYLALFKLIEARGVTVGEAGVFAHLNQAAVVSLVATGIEYEPIAGRDDLKTPTVEPDGTHSFDDHYSPVAIPSTKKNLEVFSELGAFAAPQMYI